MNINSTTAEVAFWAATSATNPTQVDCYALAKEGSTVTYSTCMQPIAPMFSLLTGQPTSDAQPGTHNQVAWR